MTHWEFSEEIETRHFIRSVRFMILGRAQQRGSKQAMVRYGRDGKPITKDGRVLTFAKDMNANSKDWMQEVRSAYHQQQGAIALMKGPIQLSVMFFFARPQSHYGSGKNEGKLKQSAPVFHSQSPDLAKLLRSLEDALSGVAWRDDKQVFRYGPGTGRYWTEFQESTEVLIHEFE